MAADGRAHILVMNDVQEILDLLRDRLEAEGYRISTSLYVLHLDRIKHLKPDLIVLGLMFEGRDKGSQLLPLSRLDRDLCRIPVILCTAAVRTVREMEGHLAAQNVGVVLEPFDIDHLLSEIEARLAGPMHGG